MNSTKQLNDDEIRSKLHCDWLTTCIKYKHRILERKLIKNGYATQTWKLIIKDLDHQPEKSELINLADDGWTNFGGSINIKRKCETFPNAMEYWVGVYID